MDLYGINPVLGKNYSDRTHFSRSEGTESGPHNKIGKFVKNDIYSSSSWSSVIHQPSQDSEPEDLPSTVDINAIKEPPTPVNASAQTRLGQIHNDCNSFALSDDQNVGDSGSDSDSESDSVNSDNEMENLRSGADSGSCSDSDSVSSHHSSCSSRSKRLSSHTSRSNSPSCNNENSRKSFTLPKNCDLSEDSEIGEDVPSNTENETKKETDLSAEKCPHNSDNLQVLNEEDLAAVFSDAKQTVRPVQEASDFNTNKKNTKAIVEMKKIPAGFSDSSSDSEMLPKQVVRDAINSIHVEPRSPVFSLSNVHSKSQFCNSNNREQANTQESFEKSRCKTPSVFGESTEDHGSQKANSRATIEIFQVRGKRGPGRPRKNKINGKIKAGKDRSKMKNKCASATVAHPVFVRVSNAFIPTFPKQNNWLRRHKKRKKKDAKEKISNPEFVKEIENLAEFFGKKCTIENKLSTDASFQPHSAITRSKINQRSKDKNKKRKHSDKESESETSSVVPHTSTSEAKTKRRHKKSATETPKVHQTNCDQRLPLKKRHYHISAPTAGHNTSNQTLNSSKVRVERHISENFNEESLKTNDERLSSKPNEFANLPPTLSSIKKEKPRKRMKDTDSDTPPVLDEYSKQPNSLNDGAFSSKPSATLLPTSVQSSKQPELITPLPNEPSSDVTSPSLKPPAGVFEPTYPLSKYKKSSIDDMLCKLKENIERLESPSKTTSASIENIDGNASDDENSLPFKRVLRPKKANTEKEKENTNKKKNKVLKDVTIRLLKLPIANSSGVKEQEGMKPKIAKRRKTRNRTGFPVLKKKKKKHQDISISTTTNKPYVKTENCLKGGEKNDLKGEEVIREIKDVKIKDKNRKTERPEVLVFEEKKEKGRSEIPIREEGKFNVRTAKRIQATGKEIIGEVEKETLVRSLRKRELPKESPANQTETKKYKIESKHKETTDMRKVHRKDEETNSMVPVGRLLRKREPPKTEHVKLAPVTEHNRKEEKKKNNNKVKEESEKDELSDDSKKDVAPKKKRKYVPAGMFSDYYKEDRSNATDVKSRFIQYKPEDHPHGMLPPPPYFGEFVRRRRVNFKLPYDLWWLQTYDKLPGRDIVESWKYKRIRMNVYYDVKPPHGYEAQACNCKMPAEKDKLGCGEDCINRVVYAECSPDLCPLKERCSNQRIQKHNGDMKLIKFMTKDKGIGVKTQKLIKAGEYIVEYVGEVVTDKEFKNRMTTLYKNDIHHYCLNLEGGLLIDGHRMGSDARFVNHSCEPNCEIQKWSVNGRFRMGLFAQRDIEPGEELTYDYNFSLFNPEEGQPCRCGSKECRGVIGGKSQRVSMPNASTSTVDTAFSTTASQLALNCSTTKNSRIRPPRKQPRKKSDANINMKNSGRRDSDSSGRMLPRRCGLHLLPVELLTPDEKDIVRMHRLFLARNLNKLQRVYEKLKRQNDNDKSISNNNKQNGVKNGKSKQPIEFMRHLNAFTQQHRFIKTRGFAQVEDDPEINKTLQLANLFRTIYSYVVSAKDEKSGETFSSLFMSLPSRKLSVYYERIPEPIDLTIIEKNIVTGVYKDVESFDNDMKKLIANNVKYYGRTSEQGIAAVRLRKAYNIAKLEHVTHIEEITGQPVPASFRPIQENPGDEEEDVIRCICGLYNDEGMMIQCERCLVWQHIGCVKASTDVEHYHCERCSSREVDYEIPLDVPPPEIPSPNEKHYLTLMRDDLQIRQGDTVYILRDIRDPKTNSRYTYQTVEKPFKYEDCDILRVEQLWKTQNGEKFAFGHHYLRPCETFHEPTRKFFPNELLKRSVYETVPLDLIIGRCYVLDLRTYCKGRPVDADPEHIYICEYSVNKEMNTFYKIKSKQPCSVSTKSYAFETYDTRLRPTRTYTPHITPTIDSYASGNNFIPSKTTVVANQNKTRGNKPKELVETQRITDPAVENFVDEDDLPLARIKDGKVDKQKQHLNSILLKLLAKKPCKSPLNVSYLLEMGRRNRTNKKPAQQKTTNT